MISNTAAVTKEIMGVKVSDRKEPNYVENDEPTRFEAEAVVML